MFMRNDFYRCNFDSMLEVIFNVEVNRAGHVFSIKLSDITTTEFVNNDMFTNGEK